MRVQSIATNIDAYRQPQYYAGEHLAYYHNPKASEIRARFVTDVERGIFTRYLEKENGLRDMVSTSSTKEKEFLEKSLEHSANEDLLRQLNYKDGVHYSAAIPI